MTIMCGSHISVAGERSARQSLPGAGGIVAGEKIPDATPMKQAVETSTRLPAGFFEKFRILCKKVAYKFAQLGCGVFSVFSTRFGQKERHYASMLAQLGCDAISSAKTSGKFDAGEIPTGGPKGTPKASQPQLHGPRPVRGIIVAEVETGGAEATVIVSETMEERDDSTELKDENPVDESPSPVAVASGDETPSASDVPVDVAVLWSSAGFTIRIANRESVVAENPGKLVNVLKNLKIGVLNVEVVGLIGVLDLSKLSSVSTLNVDIKSGTTNLFPPTNVVDMRISGDVPIGGEFFPSLKSLTVENNNSERFTVKNAPNLDILDVTNCKFSEINLSTPGCDKTRVTLNDLPVESVALTGCDVAEIDASRCPSIKTFKLLHEDKSQERRPYGNLAVLKMPPNTEHLATNCDIGNGKLEIGLDRAPNIIDVVVGGTLWGEISACKASPDLCKVAIAGDVTGSIHFPGSSVTDFTVGNIGGDLWATCCDHLEVLRLGNVGGRMEVSGSPQLKEVAVGDVGGVFLCSECPNLHSVEVGNIFGEMVDLSHNPMLQELDFAGSASNVKTINLEGCARLKLFKTPPDAEHVTKVELKGCEQLDTIHFSEGWSYPNMGPGDESVREYIFELRDNPTMNLNISGPNLEAVKFLGNGYANSVNIRNAPKFNTCDFGSLEIRELQIEGCPRFEELPQVKCQVMRLTDTGICGGNIPAGVREFAFECFNQEGRGLELTGGEDVENLWFSLRSSELVVIPSCPKLAKFSGAGNVMIPDGFYPFLGRVECRGICGNFAKLDAPNLEVLYLYGENESPVRVTKEDIEAFPKLLELHLACAVLPGGITLPGQVRRLNLLKVDELTGVVMPANKDASISIADCPDLAKFAVPAGEEVLKFAEFHVAGCFKLEESGNYKKWETDASAQSLP